jgi:hypothetical protein
MKKRRFNLSVFAAILLLSALLFYNLPTRQPVIDEYVSVDKAPRIRPDYAETIIPPNIAPLNFLVKEPAAQYLVKIYSTTGDTIDVFTKTPAIIIPIRPWKKLLTANRGGKLHFDVYANNGPVSKPLQIPSQTKTLTPISSTEKSAPSIVAGKEWESISAICRTSMNHSC